MGKTTIVYAIETILRSTGIHKKKTLVICPIKPMYSVWPKQKNDWAEFSHLRVKVAHGKDRVSALKSLDYDILVINPEGLEWLEEHEAFVRDNFGILVVDESTKFKNTSTQRFKRIKKLIKWFQRRYILTGSFTPNGLLDLFGQVYVLDEGSALGRYITHYKVKYFYPTDYMGYTLAPHPWAAGEIAKKISPLCLVLEREGNITMPTLLPTNDIYVDLPADARTAYDSVERDLVLAMESGEIITAANAAVATSKCRQVANGGVYGVDGGWHPLHTAKIEALKDLVDQLSGEPLLVVYEFKFDYEMLRAAFPDAVWLTSGNAKKDDEAIAKFCTGSHPVGIAQITSISLGIDGLQKGCSNICMYGLTWNLQDYSQTIDRVWRVGQRSEFVSLHRIIARDTVDQRVLQVLDAKERTQTGFLALLQAIGKGY